MVKGRQGLYLEAWKFSLYISMPILASVYYSNPENQKYWADYWQFITYPENPNTNVKQKIQELAQQKQEQRQQQLAYQQQLQALQQSAERSATFQRQQQQQQQQPQAEVDAEEEDGNQSLSWRRRIGGWFSKSSSTTSNDE